MPITGPRAVKEHFKDAQYKGYANKEFRVSLYDEEGNGDFIWWFTLKAPKGSLYEGGEYDGKIYFGLNYPWIGPYVQFSTFIYHPNINRDIPYGVKLDCIRNNWDPDNTAVAIFEGIQKAMMDPDPRRQRGNEGKHLNPAIAHEFTYLRERFNKTAVERNKIAIPEPGNGMWEDVYPPKLPDENPRWGGDD